MKVVVVGAGISGLSSAYYLTQLGHEVTVLESGERLGGHTATIDVDTSQGVTAIDTGFIVFNDWTYPNFIALLDEIGVASQETTMGFSVSCEHSGLEYAGGNLNMLFAQRRNLFSPKFLRMVSDILRFNREAIADVNSGKLDQQTTLGDYLQKNGYSDYFIDKYLVPMGAAIWSAGVSGMRDFPVAFFIEFFKNHGLLSVTNRPQWRVIQGGSKSYIEPLISAFKERVFTSVRIDSLLREESCVSIKASGRCESGPAQIDDQFDAMVVATHSDQALQLPTEITPLEREILGAIPYQPNSVVLHTDVSLLPASTRTWSSWNYRIAKGASPDEAQVTYNMNILQGLDLPETYCVSLNQQEVIDASQIIGEYEYSHPVFTAAGQQAKARWQEIAGVNKTWYCGAYWHNGFHEDGVSSGLRAAKSVHATASAIVNPDISQEANAHQSH